jgi:hypothetical protein
MWALGGHLGSAVSALVDGQLDEESTEQAWLHVQHCPQCRRRVEREGWVKRQLAEMSGPTSVQEPSERLLGSLYELEPGEAAFAQPGAAAAAADAWAAVNALEKQGRGRRRVGLALAGAGSVGVAVFGLSALGTSPFSGSAGNPAASLTGAARTGAPSPALVAPAADVRGRLRGWTWLGGDSGEASPIAVMSPSTRRH